MNAKPFILAAVGLGVAGGLLFASGVLSKWDGTYSGIVRRGTSEAGLSSPQAGSVSVLKNPGEKGDAILLLNAPDLKGGSCALTFERHFRRMTGVAVQSCAGSAKNYSVFSGSTMDLDGDSLSVKLDLIPDDAQGALDFAQQIHLEFVGTRSGGSSAQLPSLLSATSTGAPPAKSCVPGDWSQKALPPLLKPGNAPEAQPPDRLGQGVSRWGLVTNGACTDPTSLAGPGQPTTATSNGVTLSILHVDAVSKDGSQAYGGQCTFGVKLASGDGATVTLGPDYVMPFNTVTAVERVGGAVWMALEANGYAKDFPRGSSYVVATDLCQGRVIWRSDNQTSNGPIMLLGDYLVTGYGFTDEARTLYVLNAHTGAVVQKLPLPGNPQKMALSGGILVVNTNHGMATFAVRDPSTPNAMAATVQPAAVPPARAPSGPVEQAPRCYGDCVECVLGCNVKGEGYPEPNCAAACLGKSIECCGGMKKTPKNGCGCEGEFGESPK